MPRGFPESMPCQRDERLRDLQPCAALAGIVYIARLNTAEAIIGGQFALQAIGAVAIGEYPSMAA